MSHRSIEIAGVGFSFSSIHARLPVPVRQRNTAACPDNVVAFRALRLSRRELQIGNAHGFGYGIKAGRADGLLQRLVSPEDAIHIGCVEHRAHRRRPQEYERGFPAAGGNGTGDMPPAALPLSDW